MRHRFVMEAVLAAAYGHLLVPANPVDFVLPYASVAELYELNNTTDPIMEDPEEDELVKQNIGHLIGFFDEPLNRKKIERALQVPWRESAPLLLNDMVQFTVVNSVDHATFGELFDPVETELIVLASKLNLPLLTDQVDFQTQLIEAEIPIHIYDIEDFEFAVEDLLTIEQIRKLLDQELF